MDEKLLLLLNREWTNPALDWLAAAASNFAAWLPVFVLAGLLLLWRGGARARVFLVVLGLVLAVADGAVARTLKRVVDRPRPHQALEGVRVVELAKARPRLLALFRPVRVKPSRIEFGEVDGRSFPSSHTMNCFAAALVAAVFYGARAAWTFPLAALVAWSRIYTGSHWPSDVAVSIALGLGVAALVAAASLAAVRKWWPRSWTVDE